MQSKKDDQQLSYYSTNKNEFGIFYYKISLFESRSFSKLILINYINKLFFEVILNIINFKN